MLYESMSGLLAAVLLGAAQTPPPIQNPGAPGQETRDITAAQSVDMSRSRHTEADARFMQHMIVHHAQAVEMNALIDARTDNRDVRRLGERIASTQSSEMAMMRRWLAEREEPVGDPALHAGHGGHEGHADHGDSSAHGDHHGHGGHGDAAMNPGDVAPMPGMLSPNQMAALAAARQREFDRLFLEGMILHHRGALDMVEDLLAEAGNGEDPQLSEFLTHVTADQSAEILRMQTMLSALDAPEADEEEGLRP